MRRDPRYKTVKKFLENGSVRSIQRIFKFIPKTVVCGDLGVNYIRFSKAIEDPTLFTIKDLLMIAALFNVEVIILIEMAYSQRNLNKKIKGE